VDLATVIGIIGALGIVVAAMVTGGDVMIFVNVPSILIVAIGSIFVVLAKFNMGQFFTSAKVAMNAVFFQTFHTNELIEKIVELADAARKGGLLSLEGVEIPNPFMKKGINLLIDGHEPEVVKTILYKDVDLMSERHKVGAKIFSDFGDTAPAMGMIGTLVGLVNMLSNMDDPKSIGPAMAVALLTTLYGALIANCICLPIKDKLNLRNDEDILVKGLIIDGLIGIQGGQNPRVIAETLKSYLAEKQRLDGSDEE